MRRLNRGSFRGQGCVMSTRITFALILAAAVVSPVAVYALVTTPGEILANPDRFDGQVVTIEGTMTEFQATRVSPWKSLLHF